MVNAAVGMPCPVCKVPLVMSEREKVEIDYCPQCRGVWLDRGELDKIIERAAREEQQAAPPPLPPVQQQPAYGQPSGYAQPHYDQYGRGSHGHYRHGKRKKSFLEELFD